MKTQQKKQMRGFRERIDKVDERILKLLHERGEIAGKIGKIKEAEGIEIYVPSREKQIFDRIQKINKGPYTDTALFAIYREIISATRSLEQPTKVAFLGPTATFTQEAAVKHFGNSTEYAPARDISDVFQSVEKGHADYGVVPVENSTEGVVNYTLDRFVESELKICSEIVIKVSQNLLSAESSLEDVKKVYSHPQAIAQCRKWLSLYLPHAKITEFDSTAHAAEKASKDNGAAAIASSLAADLYGLNLLVPDVQDQSINLTRFLVIGHEQAKKTGQDKTSVAFVGKHKAGVLYDLLRPFSDNKINLTKIESRPQKQKAWEYMFFVDMDGHVSDRKLQKAFKELDQHCEKFKVLGSYPKSSRVEE